MMRLLTQLKNLDWWLVFFVVAVCCIGLAQLYSAAGGELFPWAAKQGLRMGVGLVVCLMIALIPLQFWLHMAYPSYVVSLLLLVGVEAMGFVGMGAQRWIDLYVIQLQPSELVKLTMVLAIARYFHSLKDEPILQIRQTLFPLFLILLPSALVMKQPDLGTALILIMVGSSMLFARGIQLRYVVGSVLAAIVAVPVAWNFLHEYQKKRVLTFLDPSTDQLGAGYHITQAKIALGSGGFWGKGYQQGTQSYLNFLPEKQTDFIFTMFGEEHGLLGGVFLLVLYIAILAYSWRVVFSAQSAFGRFTALGVVMTFFFYLFINMGMVMGLLPVVGVPLPLMSYGGTALLTLLMGFGFLLCVDVNRHQKLPRIQGSLI